MLLVLVWLAFSRLASKTGWGQTDVEERDKPIIDAYWDDMDGRRIPITI